MKWETDRSLQARMVATLAMIAVLLLAFTVTMTTALGRLLFDEDDDLVSQDRFPDSHPPTAERVARLREIAGTLEQ